MGTAPQILALPSFVLSLAFVVSVVVSGLKDGIESVLPATNRWHDLFFTLLPVALCIVAVVGYTLTQPGRHPAAAVFMSVVWGTLAGFSAIGSYLLHTRTGGAGPDPAAWTGAAPPPREPAPPTPPPDQGTQTAAQITARTPSGAAPGPEQPDASAAGRGALAAAWRARNLPARPPSPSSRGRTALCRAAGGRRGDGATPCADSGRRMTG